MRKIISIDPGHQKCGIILADLDELLVIEGKIVKKDYVIELISNWHQDHQIKIVLLGNGTTSQYWKDKLIANKISPVILVDETRTTLRARERYMELNPNKFLFEMFFRILLFPPKNLDSIVALILIEDYLDRKFKWLKSIDFKTWP